MYTIAAMHTDGSVFEVRISLDQIRMYIHNCLQGSGPSLAGRGAPPCIIAQSFTETMSHL